MTAWEESPGFPRAEAAPLAAGAQVVPGLDAGERRGPRQVMASELASLPGVPGVRLPAWEA